MLRRTILATVLASACYAAPMAFAAGGWSWNLGYHNPPDATVGLNFLNLGSTWGFELGLGWVDGHVQQKKDQDKNKNKNNGDTEGDKTPTSATAAAAGDVNVKYFFSGNGLRPYLQAGIGIGIAAAAGKGGGLSAGTGTGFAGGGLMAGGQSFYAYAAYNLVREGDGFAQGGLGFSF